MREKNEIRSKFEEKLKKISVLNVFERGFEMLDVYKMFYSFVEVLKMLFSFLNKKILNFIKKCNLCTVLVLS